MPAMDFLALPRLRLGLSGYIVYGPVRLMDSAFKHGCTEYIREPWTVPELCARLRRLQNTKFRVGATILSVAGTILRSEKSSVELKPNELTFLLLLIRNAPLPVTREAAQATLSLALPFRFYDLGRCAVSLRHCLESVEPGLGKQLHAVRGIGYRFDAKLCG
jgi:DNA-binding response OmpR family regulator